MNTYSSVEDDSKFKSLTQARTETGVALNDPKETLVSMPKYFNLINKSLVASSTDCILITNPLKELISHIKHFKKPSLELIARSVKVLALALFRWHFCDQVLLEREDGIIHSLKGKLMINTRETLQEQYPYLLENAYSLVLNTNGPKKNEHTFESNQIINPDGIRKYYQTCYEVQLTSKETRNTINDLFKSRFLALFKKIEY
jgi:hypothetical protein